jgi:hypothetical protein
VAHKDRHSHTGGVPICDAYEAQSTIEWTQM